MALSSRRISTRLEVSGARQRIDVLVVTATPELASVWTEKGTAALGSPDDGDTLATCDTFTRAVELAAELSHPLILFDLELVDDWGIESMGDLFDAAGPISAVNAIATQRLDDAYARISEHFVIDDYRVGLPDAFVADGVVRAARERIFLRSRMSTEPTSQRSQERLKRLAHIGIALGKERELGSLLDLILNECRSLLDADAGSIYILESKSGSRPRRKLLGRVERKSSATVIRAREGQLEMKGYSLRFAAAQNDSVNIPFTEIVFPASIESIAGYTALRGEVLNIPDVYKLSEDEPYRFNSSVDKKYSYRAVSMLSIPMRNNRDEIVGVIQLINKKRDPLERLENAGRIPERVVPFEAEDLEMALALGNSAGTAIENVRLYDNINSLFEHFVNATVRSIEQRDPSTAGHSARVDRLTLGIADIVRSKTDGPFADITFTDEEMVELHYASLLHDVGKIGVREHILTKANKLFPYQRETVLVRAGLIRSSIRAKALQNKVEYISKHGPNEDVTALIDEDCERWVAQVNKDIALIEEVNKPGYLSDEKVAELEAMREREYPVEDDVPGTLVSPDEYTSLSVRKGSLSPEERHEIESHVLKSRVFLEQIPWSAELLNVPQIAGQHHEKMNGKGYPDGIPAAECPLQSRIMALADVFDSLTAGDRPYKPAIPLERALQIIGYMAKDGELDPDIVELFMEEKVWEKLNLKVLRMADATEAQRNAQ